MHGIFFEPPIDKNFLGHQLAEIYKDRVYEPLLKDKKNLTIVDVGANIGMTAYYFSRFAKVVHAIEPSIQHFETLKHMVQFNKLSNVEIHKLAIWIKEDNKGTFFHNKDNNTMFSLHAAVHSPDRRPENVRVTTLDTFYKENDIKHCDFLKIDIEGSEFEVLGSESFEKIAKITDMVFLEWHQWADRNPAQLAQSLKNNGYQVKTMQAGANLMIGTK